MFNVRGECIDYRGSKHSNIFGWLTDYVLIHLIFIKSNLVFILIPSHSILQPFLENTWTLFGVLFHAHSPKIVSLSLIPSHSTSYYLLLFLAYCPLLRLSDDELHFYSQTICLYRSWSPLL